MDPKKTTASLLDEEGRTLPPVVVAQLTVKTGSVRFALRPFICMCAQAMSRALQIITGCAPGQVYTATMGLVGNTINYGTWREDHMRFVIGGSSHSGGGH